MHHYFDAITNNKGDALTGYYVRLVDADTGDEATLYADTSLTPIIADSGVADAAQVDSDGNVSIYVDVGTYHLDIYATDSTTLIRRIENVAMNIDMDTAALALAAQEAAADSATDAAESAGAASSSAASASASAAAAVSAESGAVAAEAGVIATLGGTTLDTAIIPVANRTLLAVLSTTYPAYLKEFGREGTFVWDASDLSYQVGMDTRQAVYVAPASDTDGSSGAWVRKYNGPLKIEWFGGVGDWDGATGTDNLAALRAAIAFEPLPSLNFSPEVRLSLADYYVSGTLEIETVCRLIGEGNGHDSSSATGTISTKLVWPADTKSIIIQDSDTTGATTRAGDATKSAAGSHLEGFCVAHATQGTDLTAHGIWMRAKSTLLRLTYENIAGNAIHNIASSGGSGENRGNTNDWRVIDNLVLSCGGDGIHTRNTDANAGYCIGFQTKLCGGCGIYDVETLGNTYIAPQISGYGTYGGTLAGVYHLGRKYQLITSGDTDETLGDTTTPGTAAHIWYDLGTLGAASAAFPQWVSGTSYKFRSPIHITGSSNFSTVINPYVEAGATIGHVDGPAVVHGGAGAFTNRSTALKATQGLLAPLWSQTGIGAWKYTSVGSTERTNYGEYQYTLVGSGNPTDPAYPPNLLSHYREKDGGQPFFWGYAANVADHRMWYDGQKYMVTFTGPSTALTFGRSTAQPYYIGFTDFALFDPADGNTARIYGIRSAVPASDYHAQGEIYWNVAPSLTGVMSWVTTASGTPGTFAANYINARADATTGIGYVTGAGGAVTQATSRTTGVTLNKVCGAITLVSAAGSASWQSFTVTNSAVAATDVVRVVQKSGADKNMIHVTAVGAGSFEITFATTGGTTTEQPVFNFSIVKAVAA